MQRVDVEPSQPDRRPTAPQRVHRPGPGIDSGRQSRWLALLVMLVVFLSHDILVASASHFPADPQALSTVHASTAVWSHEGGDLPHMGNTHIPSDEEKVAFDCLPGLAVLLPSVSPAPDVDGCMPDPAIDLAQQRSDPVITQGLPALSAAVRRAMLQVYLN